MNSPFAKKRLRNSGVQIFEEKRKIKLRPNMDHERLKYVLSSLKVHELTLRERQFVEAVEKYFHEKGKVTDQQESVLEGIYREKIWIRKVFPSQSHLLKTRPPDPPH